MASLPSGVSLVRALPSQLRFDFERPAQRAVPVTVRFTGALEGGLRVAGFDVEPKELTVTGPGILDVTIWRQKESMTVHLVNLTNPMMMKGPFRELLPVGEQKVTVRLPEQSRVKAVRLLAADQSPGFRIERGELSVVTSRIVDHEIVAIDFRS